MSVRLVLTCILIAHDPIRHVDPTGHKLDMQDARDNNADKDDM